jgi:hypothetical protein
MADLEPTRSRDARRRCECITSARKAFIIERDITDLRRGALMVEFRYGVPAR